MAASLNRDLVECYDSVSSESDTSDEEGEQLIDDGDNDILPNSEIVPFAFEPTCSEQELQERLARLTEKEETEPASSSTGWCSCDHCVYLEFEPVNECCKKSELVNVRIEQEQCVMLTNDFPLVCLHTTILETSLGIWHHTHGERRELNNANYRFAAYRQFIGWIYGKLGRHERRPIPSCVLRKIRETFLSADNQYVAFSYDD